jgi:hypothetical protein
VDGLVAFGATPDFAITPRIYTQQHRTLFYPGIYPESRFPSKYHLFYTAGRTLNHLPPREAAILSGAALAFNNRVFFSIFHRTRLYDSWLLGQNEFSSSHGV